MNQILVTTGDLQQPYEVVGPVYFQVSNKGILSSALDKLMRHYSGEIQRMREKGTMSGPQADWGFLYGEWSVGQSQFEAAFYIATQELKKRAKLVGADAIIGMRQDIDMDTTGFAFFYLQMYGTAVRFKKELPLAEQYHQAEELMHQGDYAGAETLYFRLGDFRDSREKAKAAYAAFCSTTYRRAEEEAKHQEQERRWEQYRKLSASGADSLQVFLCQAEDCAKVSEVLTLWENTAVEPGPLTEAMDKKIRSSARMEKLYGAAAGNISGLLEELRNLAGVEK